MIDLRLFNLTEAIINKKKFKTKKINLKNKIKIKNYL